MMVLLAAWFLQLPAAASSSSSSSSSPPLFPPFLYTSQEIRLLPDKAGSVIIDLPDPEF
jgi:hypothetical protein